MTYIVEQDYPDGTEQFSCANLKAAMQKARELNVRFTDRVFIYYQRKDETLADGYWVIYANGETRYKALG